MKKPVLSIRAKIKPDFELDELKRYGFNWVYCDQENGVHWTKGDVTIYSNSREVVYKKLTQEVLNCILLLCCKGLLIIL